LARIWKVKGKNENCQWRNENFVVFCRLRCGTLSHDPHGSTINRALLRASQKEEQMKKLLTVTLTLLCVFTLLSTGAVAQDSTSTSTTKTSPTKAKRGPIFRATKDQINQAQGILKTRGFYAGEQVGKLDDATREGLRKFQQAEGLKVTGTLNKVTLEKMNIVLTDKQKAM